MKQLLGQGGGRMPLTRLSRSGRDLGRITGILRLAWRSLGLVSIMLFSQSCIVADPPEYRAPGRTRPVLNVYSAVPTATQVLSVPSTSLVRFTVQVRSEDAGEGLKAVFWVDYQIKESFDPPRRGESYVNSNVIPASTYDNTGRNVQVTWYPAMTGTGTGCHFMSLIVAHDSSFYQNDNLHLNPSYADDDAAIVTWTVNVNPPNDDTLKDCPTKTDPPVVP